jgi:hypothetical protein
VLALRLGAHFCQLCPCALQAVFCDHVAELNDFAIAATVTSIDERVVFYEFRLYIRNWFHWRGPFG